MWLIIATSWIEILKDMNVILNIFFIMFLYSDKPQPCFNTALWYKILICEWHMSRENKFKRTIQCWIPIISYIVNYIPWSLYNCPLLDSYCTHFFFFLVFWQLFWAFLSLISLFVLVSVTISVKKSNMTKRNLESKRIISFCISQS